MSAKTDEFIKVVGLLARNEYLSRDKWILPSVCIAQAALESGWNLSARSVFGIKGDGFTSTTSEFYNGNYVEIQDSFRAYPDLASSVVGYYDFLRDTITEDGLNVRYGKALNKSDYREAIDGLINTYDYPYATDPEYIGKIVSIVEDFNLTAYDRIEPIIEEVEQTDVAEEIAPPQATDEPQQSNGSYIVQPGDTLSGIASTLGLNHLDLASYNGIINADLIYPGQVLAIPGADQVFQDKIAIVLPGDGFWSIAERCLGDGNRYAELAKYNRMTTETKLYTDMVLRLPR